MQVDRREWFRMAPLVLGALLACAVGAESAQAAGSAITIVARLKNDTVLANTKDRFPDGVVVRGGLVTKVGSLAGRLNYRVNGRWIPAAATYEVPRGAVITWYLV